MLVIVAILVPQVGKYAEVEEVLKRLIPEVQTEDGCELYALHKTDDQFVFLEKWRDLAALNAHRAGSNVKALNESLQGLVAGPPDIRVMKALPIGDPIKGMV